MRYTPEQRREYARAWSKTEAGVACRKRRASSSAGKKYLSEWCKTPAGRKLRRELAQRYRVKLRAQVIEKYGGQCVCGFKDIRALCIDHVNGGGKADRGKTGDTMAFYRRLLKEPRSKLYQVLCMNCNFIKVHTHKELYLNRKVKS